MNDPAVAGRYQTVVPLRKAPVAEASVIVFVGAVESSKTKLTFAVCVTVIESVVSVAV